MSHNSRMGVSHSKAIVATTLLAAIAVAAIPTWQRWQAAQPPDFTLYPAGEARKSAFFSYMSPLIDAENARWLDRRARLEALRSALQAGSIGAQGKRQLLWLKTQAAFFDVTQGDSPGAQIDALLEHVDEVPRSLALAQAAKESAWGTSRFAVDAHNYFGQRCYEKGCGLVPESRPAGTRFEVRRFDSVESSIESYMNNINSHPQYEGFRAYRAAQRAVHKPVNGIRAAEQLAQYSERRQAYVDEIQSLIHFNKLDQLIEAATDRPTATRLETNTP
jgi:Bax protein